MNNFKISIYINGQKKLVNVNNSLLDILETLNIQSNFIAIELNKEIIPKSVYSSKKILEGDSIEILEMIGGG